MVLSDGAGLPSPRHYLVPEERTLRELSFCKSCDTITKVTTSLRYRQGYLISDTSTCDCGNVVWEWAYQTRTIKEEHPKPQGPKGQASLF